jgi:HEAT repeat protein
MRYILTGVLTLGICTVVWAENAEVQALIAKLEGADSDARRDAAKALGELGSEAKLAVPALTKRLNDRDAFVRRFAAESLGKIGADAKSAVPKLSLALSDERKEVGLAAVEALTRIGPPAIAALTSAVKDPNKDPQVRKKAAAGLGKIGTPAHSAVPTLTDVLTGRISNNAKKGKAVKTKGNDDDLRVEAAIALGELGRSEDTKAIEALKSIAESKERNALLKKAATESYTKLSGKKPEKKKKKK